MHKWFGLPFSSCENWTVIFMSRIFQLPPSLPPPPKNFPQTPWDFHPTLLMLPAAGAAIGYYCRAAMVMHHPITAVSSSRLQIRRRTVLLTQPDLRICAQRALVAVLALADEISLTLASLRFISSDIRESLHASDTVMHNTWSNKNVGWPAQTNTRSENRRFTKNAQKKAPGVNESSPGVDMGTWASATSIRQLICMSIDIVPTLRSHLSG